ncbi:hypothetical protein WDU99_00170 [Microbacterium sp. Mu-80]|uniref:Secreted protein n=1 Tax=Microbacterium bandirmense TaxID=3122050 RepID=A0ABU8L8Q0_9MICO
MPPTPSPSPTGTAEPSVIDVVAYLPLIVAAIGLTGLLIAAAWSARSAIIVRLLDSQRDTSQRFAEFQHEAVAAMNELAVAMSRYIAQPGDIAAIAEEVAQRRPPGAQSVTISLGDTAQERVRVATDRWRLTLARAHEFSGQPLSDALSAVDSQREVVVNRMNAKQWDDARDANERMLSHEIRQAYRRLQIVAMEYQIASAQLLRTRLLRRYLRRWEQHMQNERQRGEDMIADYEREMSAAPSAAPDLPLDDRTP